MRNHDLPPRNYSPSGKYFFDIKDYGEVAMSVVRSEITTSFNVDGTKTFLVDDCDPFFMGDEAFVICGVKGVLVHYLEPKETFRLMPEEMDERAYLRVDHSDQENPVLLIDWHDRPREELKLKDALRMFSAGRGYF